MKKSRMDSKFGLASVCLFIEIYTGDCFVSRRPALPRVFMFGQLGISVSTIKLIIYRAKNKSFPLTYVLFSSSFVNFRVKCGLD